MTTSRPKKQSGPVYDASSTAGQPGRACKILPFRQAGFREYSGKNELVRDCVAVELADEGSLEERGSFLAACLPEYPDTVSCHGCTWREREPTGTAPFLTPRWLKRVLLMSVFTAWTAAAIAIAVALG